MKNTADPDVIADLVVDLAADLVVDLATDLVVDLATDLIVDSAAALVVDPAADLALDLEIICTLIIRLLQNMTHLVVQIPVLKKLYQKEVGLVMKWDHISKIY